MTVEQREALSDKVADVLWWLSGWIAAQPDDSTATVDTSHVRALREVRVLLKDEALTTDDLAAVRLLKEYRTAHKLANDALDRCVGDLVILARNVGEPWRADFERIIENARERRS